MRVGGSHLCSLCSSSHGAAVVLSWGAAAAGDKVQRCIELFKHHRRCSARTAPGSPAAAVAAAHSNDPCDCCVHRTVGRHDCVTLCGVWSPPAAAQCSNSRVGCRLAAHRRWHRPTAAAAALPPPTSQRYNSCTGAAVGDTHHRRKFTELGATTAVQTCSAVQGTRGREPLECSVRCLLNTSHQAQSTGCAPRWRWAGAGAAAVRAPAG